VGTWETSPEQWQGESVRSLRARWHTASLASGWPFPADWPVPGVDAVCELLVDGAGLAAAVDRLAQVRAEHGAGLGETLLDVAALHAVRAESGDGLVCADPDATPARLIRVAALAWADVQARQLTGAEVRDGLTGLTTAAYLRARLAEVYREQRGGGADPRIRYTLVVVRPALCRTAGWSGLAAMALLGETVREVFTGGQTLALAGPATVVVLAERTGQLAGQLAGLRDRAAGRFAGDPQLRALGAPPIWRERLPANHIAACRLVARLGRG
jgi:hypothetical protein